MNQDGKLPLEDYKRYGRQMILEGFGLSGQSLFQNCFAEGLANDSLLYIGQLKLQQASVVVVGAGGLGCPALQYLAAAGIGKYLLTEVFISLNTY